MAHNRIEQHAKVLELASVTHNLVRHIDAPVDPHKRFNRNDLDDPYGEVIDWLYHNGSEVFKGYDE